MKKKPEKPARVKPLAPIVDPVPEEMSLHRAVRKWDPAFIKVARAMCLEGAIDMQLCEALGCSISTLRTWRTKYPEFHEACKLGKEVADDLVEESLFRRATGYTFDSEKIITVGFRAVRVPVTEHVPPDVKACMFWLQNRRPKLWKNVSESRLTGPNGGPVEVKDVSKLTDAELAAIVAQTSGEGTTAAQEGED